MHVLAFVNQKGGCGKTTTALNLACALAAKDARVLLVDLDPQAHATLGLGCAVDHACAVESGARSEPSIVDVLVERASLSDVLRPAPGGFQLAPATLELAEFEDVATRMVRPERMLAKALETVEHQFDFVIIDCPPRADGVLTANAIRACDTAMLVVECSAFALQGALKALTIFEETAQTLGHPLRVRVVGTLFDRRTRFARELLIAMQARFGESLFDTVIRHSVRLREAAACGLPVQMLDPACRASTEFAALADEVLQYDRETPIEAAQSSRSLVSTSSDAL
jgi:chromosome partitioning protein